jgi:hypothetical protein
MLFPALLSSDSLRYVRLIDSWHLVSEPDLLYQIHPPACDRAGALPIHFPSFNSFKSHTARLFLESKRPSCPLPMMLAFVGTAAPFVKIGTPEKR